MKFFLYVVAWALLGASMTWAGLTTKDLKFWAIEASAVLIAIFSAEIMGK